MKRHTSIIGTLFALSLLTTPALAGQNTSKTAAEPMYLLTDPNPATLTQYGTGRLRIPSFRIDIGTNIPVSSFVTDITNLQKSLDGIIKDSATTESSSLSADITSLFGNISEGIRMDYDLDVAILSYSGSPFAGLKIAGRPLALGFTVGLEKRGYADIKLSSEFQDGLKSISSAVPDLLSTAGTVTGIASNANNLISQTTNLRSNVSELAVLSTSLLAKNALGQNISSSDITQAQNLVDLVITDTDKILVPAKELVSTATTTTQTAQTLLNTVKTISDGGVNITTANDAHMTLNLSGAYPVLENEQFSLSFGTNVKLFVPTFQMNTGQLPIGGNIPLVGQVTLSEVSGLSSFDNVEKSINQIDAAINDVSGLISTVDKVKGRLNEAKNITTENVSSLTNQAASLTSELTGVNQQLQDASTNFNAATQSLSSIQKSVQDDLQNAKVKGSTLVANGPGLGLDFGLEAVIQKNLRLGLFLQNPVVIWQGTETPFEIGFTTENDQLKPTFTSLEDESKGANYTATVPLTTQLSAQYVFDDLLPQFTGLYASGMFEYVGNGRPMALTASLQKQWGPGYIGLGGRAGGISSLVFLQGGLRQAGAFGLDLQVGISPAGTGLPVPGLGALGMAGLGMYLQF